MAVQKDGGRSRGELIEERDSLHRRIAALEGAIGPEGRLEKKLVLAGSIIETIREPLLILDGEFRIVSVNPAFHSTFGIAPEEAEGRLVFEIGGGKWNIPRLKKRLEGILSRDESFDDLELAYGFETIGRRTLLFNARRVRGAAGDARLILVAVEDVTERRRNEERIDRLTRILRAIRNVNQLITREKDSGRLIEKACGLLIEFGVYKGAWIALLGGERKLTLSAEAGHGDAFRSLAGGMERGELCACGLAALDKPGAVLTDDPLSQCGDCPLRGRGCRERVMTIRLESGGKVYGILSVSAPGRTSFDSEEEGLLEEVAGDVAFAIRAIGIEEERKKAEAEREELERQLEQARKLEAIGRLAGGVAHDFNNMLNVILGNTELILSRLPPDDPLAEGICEIETAARRSADLTSKLLALSRRQIVEPRVMDINAHIGAMEKVLARLVGEDIGLVFYPARDLWRIKFDPSQVDQIVLNLAANARDAMDRGGKLTIETANVSIDENYCRTHAGFMTGQYVLLAVSDDGAGMDPDVLRHAFEPFFTTKSVGRGTGLGLAMVYGIVRQNGGFINAYSEPGKGSTFRIYLPRCLEEQEEETPPAADESPLEGTETILLVEDDDLVRALAEKMLRQIGYSVLIAETVEDALDRCRESREPIALLLTDVVMPGMSGKDLKEKAEPLRPGMKTLFMSGYTANAVAHHGILEEGVNFLQKPFSMKELARAVRAAIDG